MELKKKKKSSDQTERLLETKTNQGLKGDMDQCQNKEQMNTFRKRAPGVGGDETKQISANPWCTFFLSTRSCLRLLSQSCLDRISVNCSAIPSLFTALVNPRVLLITHPGDGKFDRDRALHVTPECRGRRRESAACCLEYCMK